MRPSRPRSWGMEARSISRSCSFAIRIRSAKGTATYRSCPRTRRLAESGKKGTVGQLFPRWNGLHRLASEGVGSRFCLAGEGEACPVWTLRFCSNEGFVLLSLGADTSEMVCDAIWRWWQVTGKQRYWHASGLLLLCDCGGSNGYRVLRFKEELNGMANDPHLVRGLFLRCCVADLFG